MSDKKPSVKCVVECGCGRKFMYVLFMDTQDSVEVQCTCGTPYKTQKLEAKPIPTIPREEHHDRDDY